MQLYVRNNTLYFWSRKDGEICVEPRLETPSMIMLWRCDADEPFLAIRRNDKLWNQVAWMFGKQKKRSRLRNLWGMMSDSGIQEDIYKRGDQIFYWSVDQGELPVRPEWDGALGGYVLFTRDSRKWASTPNIEPDDALYPRLRRLIKNPKRPPTTKKKPKRKRNVGHLVAKALR